MYTSATTKLSRQLRPVLSFQGTVALLLIVICAQTNWARGAEKKTKTKFTDVTLHTRDGVILQCTYYAAEPSKQTVPIILLHDWNGSRADMHTLALTLQRKKHTVIVPDLRGHGQSVYIASPVGGEPIKIDREKMKKNALESTVLDVEAVKRFLLEKNNKSELNIEQLCVVGSGYGSIIALNWAMLDWSKRSLPAYKIGHDVKALALVSPLQSFHGMSARTALAHPRVRSGLATLIIVGRNDAPSYSEAKRIFKSFERYHDQKAQDLGFVDPETSLQGAKLIDAKGLDIPDKIAQFVDWSLVRRAAQFPWRDRTSPLDQE